MTAGVPTHRAPTTCPVCSTSLITLRLGCPSCATELSGHFDSCRYCRLDAADLAILEVFLRSRGNVRDVQAHLGVSYPTARLRLIEVLERLGLDEPNPEPPRAAAPPVATAPGAPSGAAAALATSSMPGASSSADRARVLRDLAAGRIDVAAAESLLR